MDIRDSQGRTKLVDPDVTSAFELCSVDGFTPQQRIPDKLGIGLGVDHRLQKLSLQPDRQMLQHLFQQAMRNASSMQTELLALPDGRWPLRQFSGTIHGASAGDFFGRPFSSMSTHGASKS